MQTSVVYVESNPALHRSMVEWLESEGMQVISFTSGTAASRYLASITPDLVIANQYIADRTGLDLLVSLRGRRNYCPFILFHISRDVHLLSTGEALDARCLPLTFCGSGALAETIGALLAQQCLVEAA